MKRRAPVGPIIRAMCASVLWLALALPLSAASPSPGPGAGGDPRSSGQGPGLVGDPLFALLVVVAIGFGALMLTLAYVRLTSRGRA